MNRLKKLKLSCVLDKTILRATVKGGRYIRMTFRFFLIQQEPLLSQPVLFYRHFPVIGDQTAWRVCRSDSFSGYLVKAKAICTKENGFFRMKTVARKMVLTETRLGFKLNHPAFFIAWRKSHPDVIFVSETGNHLRLSFPAGIRP